MAYSATDLANVQAAILALSTGTRVKRITINGQDTEYTEASLGDLRSLKKEIKADLADVAAKTRLRPRYMRAHTQKGL